MKKLVTKIFLLSLTLSIFSLLYAKDIGGVEVEEQIKNPALILNGAGIRSKFIFDLYVGALYLKKKSSNAKEIINSDTPMAIRLYITSSMISSDKMKEATMEGFEKATNSKIDPIKKRIDRFISVFQEDIKDGDIYTFIYEPKTGVKIYKNNSLKSTIEGLDFKKALFGIWLCDKPAQDSLKEEMLSL